MKQQFKRRNFFINKSFQGKYIFQFYLFMILGALIFSLIFSYLTADTLTVTYNNYNLKLDSTPFMLFKQMLAANWIIFIPIGLIVIIVGLFQTHRIAGPLFKLERVLESMAEGNIETDSWLRTKDEGKELMQKLNNFNVFLAKQINEMRNQTAEIGDDLEQVDRHMEDIQKDALKLDIDKLRLSIAKLNSTLDVFKIKK